MKSTVCFFNSLSQESEANYLWYLVPQETLMECCQSFMDWTFFFRFWMYELQVNQCDKQHCPRHCHYKSLAKIYDFFNKCKKFFFIWVFVQIDFQKIWILLLTVNNSAAICGDFVKTLYMAFCMIIYSVLFSKDQSRFFNGI